MLTMVKRFNLYSVTGVWPTRIPVRFVINVTQQSEAKKVHVWSYCQHEILGGECHKCRLAIEDDPREYEDE